MTAKKYVSRRAVALLNEALLLNVEFYFIETDKRVATPIPVLQSNENKSYRGCCDRLSVSITKAILSPGKSDLYVVFTMTGIARSSHEQK